MIFKHLNRRTLLVGLGAVGVSYTLPAQAQTLPVIQVLKDPDCGCCSAWIEIMRQEGFEMEVRNTSWEELSRIKARFGIPEEMASCHTAEVEGYLIEGHVPSADIRRLLAERPEAVGLSVPGMPYGSPGMGLESERESYSVFLIHKDGQTTIYTHYEVS